MKLFGVGMENHLNRFIRYVLYFFILGIFVFAPFDIVLNFKFLGFNFRFVTIFYVLFMLLVTVIMTKEFLSSKKMYLPLWFLLLLIAGILNFLFIFNSVLIVRGLFYALWFIFFIFFIFLLINIFNYLNLKVLVNLYLISFLVNGFFGIIQQVAFYLFDVVLFMTQFGRANGFTYEPSYFSTYLSVGAVLSFMLALLYSGNLIERWLYYVTFSVIFTSLILSTSKFFILIIGFSLVVLALFIFFARDLLRVFDFRRNLIISTLSFVVVFGVSFFLVQFAPMIFTTTTSGISSKYTEVSENAGDTGFGPRIVEMKNTIKVALRNPLIGTSLGGVAPHKAIMAGIKPKSNEDVKPYEPMNVFIEIIAGLGVIGALVLFTSWAILSYQSWNVSLNLLKVGKYFEFVVLFSLLTGFVLEFVLLFWNQNILRFYFWNHLAILGFALEKLK